jgi:hypothetical protein
LAGVCILFKMLSALISFVSSQFVLAGTHIPF